MRTCTKTFHIRLTEKEYQTLCRKAKLTGLPKSTYIRFMIAGSCPKERPSEEFCITIRRQLQGMGSNIHQIARKANALGYIDAPMYQRESEKWYQFYFDFYDHYVMPEKIDIKATVERGRKIIENEQEDDV